MSKVWKQESVDEEQPLLPGTTYTSLPSIGNGRHIRLLELHPSRLRGPLQGRLRPGSLATSRYEALSYVWGASTQGQQIGLGHGSAIHITDNLHRALLRLRHRFRTRVLWIDAICINQANTEEKSAQVSMMGDIFAFAQSTIVWLGDTSQTWSVSLQPLLHLDAFHQIWCRRNKKTLRDLRNLLSAFGMLVLNYPLAVDEALAANHPCWIDRTWTQQEYVLSEHCTLAWGNRTCEFDIGYLSTLLDLAQRCDMHVPTFQNFHGRLSNLQLMKERYALRSLDLCIAAERTSHTQASDGRDKIYGLLGLIKTEEAKSLPVAYTTPVAEVYARATYISIATRGFDILESLRSFRLKRLPGLPSWAVDFSECPRVDISRGYSFLDLELTSENVSAYFTGVNAGYGTERADNIQIVERAQLLSVKAVRLDTVQHATCGIDFQTDARSATKHEALRRHFVAAIQRLLAEKTKSERSDVEARHRNVQPPQPPTTAGGDLPAMLASLLEHWRSQITTTSSSLPIHGNHNSNKQASNSQLWLDYYLRYAGAIHDSVSLTVLDSGLVALTPHDIQPKDQLVVAPKARLPLVLRKRGERWTFQGFAYVYGLDSDALLRSWQDKSVVPETFMLC